MSQEDSKLLSVNAYAAKSIGSVVEPYNFEYDALTGDEVLISVTHCGICHSDLHLMQGDWGDFPSEERPFVCGHEVCGKVIATGKDVTHLKNGDVVGVGWVRSTCLDRSCRECLAKGGHDQLCKSKVTTCAEGNRGGFADKIKVSSSWAFKIPENLPPQYAAPLLCAGITTFQPIEKHCSPGDRVAVISVGGLGALCIQWASKWGCVTTAISRGTGKKELALSLGAKNFIDLTDMKQLIAARESFDVIVVCGPHDQKWSAIVAMLKGNGVLHFVAVPPSPPNIHVGELLSTQLTITASSVGGRPQTNRMLQFAADHQILPMIEEFPFSDINKALEKVKAGDVRFRAVLKH